MASKSLVILDLDKQVHRILRWMMNIVDNEKQNMKQRTNSDDFMSLQHDLMRMSFDILSCNSLPSLVLGITIMHLSKAKVR